jgi:hypothetical protein
VIAQAARRARQDQSRRELRSASARGHRGNLSLVKSMTTEFTIGLGDVT